MTLVSRVKSMVHRKLRDRGYYHIDEFHRPYVVKKSIEGVDFLLSIRDVHARLWYDLYSTDPEWPEMRFIRDHLIKQGDTVVECGSHHGCTTTMLARWVGAEGAVHAYEPSKFNFDVLTENVALNGNEEIIQAHYAAVGAENCKVQFVELANESMGSHVASAGENGSSDNEIPQCSLHNHIDDNVSLIKLDTQGYVYQPLLGAKELIQSQRPHLALEIDGKGEIQKYGDNWDALFEIIDHGDYDYFAQFDYDKPAEPIAYGDLLTEWQSRNGFTQDVHLFAVNRHRSV